MERNHYIIIAVVIISLGMIIWGKKGKNENLASYLGNYDFEIGEVITLNKRGAMNGVIGHWSLIYTFEVDGVSYKKFYDASFYKVNSTTELYGKYVVIYNKENPENSLLLSDHLIRSNADFEKFKEEFKFKVPY